MTNEFALFRHLLALNINLFLQIISLIGVHLLQIYRDLLGNLDLWRLPFGLLLDRLLRLGLLAVEILLALRSLLLFKSDPSSRFELLLIWVLVMRLIVAAQNAV